MVNKKEILQYHNRDNEKLFGILHYPEQKIDKNIIVVLINPGLKSRVAPHRLYLKITDLLLNSGFSVFRYDSHGIGDSEGELEGNLKEILHDKILGGELVNDVLDTIGMLKKYSNKKIILMGLCGGALTTLLASSYADKIEAAVMLGLPITFVGKKDEDFTKNLNVEYAGHIYTLYIKKIFNPQSWKRLLTFQSEYDLMWKIFYLKVKKIFLRKRKIKTFKSDHPKINSLMWDRYPTFTKKIRRQFFIFAENEKNRFEFDQEVKDYFEYTSKQNGSDLDIALIPNSNHEYSILSSQEIVLKKIEEWFNLKFN